MAQKITAPRGTQDVLTKDSYKWIMLEEKLREIVSQYNFKEIRLPTFEHTELFLRGVGDTTDIVNKEMYTFLDKGNRSITLRPEGTAQVVRSAIQHGFLNDGLPFKGYYLQSFFRYEKPQAGRLREFHQLGIELFGSPDYTADAEVILTGDKIINDLGIKDINLYINSIGCTECRPLYHKKLKEYFEEKKDNLCKDCLERLEKNPLRILDCKESKCKEINKDAPSTVENLCTECHDHFEGLKSVLEIVGLKYEINPKIVRGLDYYTKTVFEFVYDGIGSQGTVLGGGRYDGLFEQMGGNSMPSVGFGMGIERLLMTLEAEGISLGDDKSPQIFFANAGADLKLSSFAIAQKARNEGLLAVSDLMNRSLKAQMKYADKISALYTVVLGEDEIKNQKAIAKNMKTREEIAIDLSKEIKPQLGL